jgi:hypothetical protein
MSRFPLWAQRLASPAWHAGRKMRAALARTGRELAWTCAGSGLCLGENERRLASLRNREAGKRIFILGNGPSLNRTDVDRLAGETCIASNAIFLMFERKKFRPAYYTIEDYLVAEDRRAEAAALKGCWKLFPEDVRRFIPPDDQTIYLNFLRQYDGFPKFSDQFLRRVYWGGTVTFMNIQLAYYLGAKNIYLVGFDHNYARPTEKDQVRGAVITSANNDDANHFDPRYFGAGYRWHDPKVERMEEAYRIARQFLNERGVGIYNATDGGHLEVFPRVAYDSLFSTDPPQGRS